MPRICGPWLAGTFDHDRATARSALDALNSVFPTPEKVHGVWKTFQRSILEYCRDAVLYETVQTLSDERTVSSEDATTIYARVVATSLSVISGLVKDLSEQDRDRDDRLYEEIFTEAKLWEIVCNPDPGVRRSMHRLVHTCLEKQSTLIQANLKLVSNAYIYKGLHSDQRGSALNFVQTLESLTTNFATIWTEAYSGKKPAMSRLSHFLKQGSQSAPADFWDSLSILFKKLPAETLPSAEGDFRALLSSARVGLSKKEERFNQRSAWLSYFTLVNVLTSSTSNTDIDTILATQVLPVFRQYLFPSSETTEWSITGPKAASTVAKAAAIQALAPLLASEWPELAGSLIEIVRLSQPEQSKDFDKSQRHVATTGERWADLQRELWEKDRGTLHNLSELFATTNTKILDECISTLKARNGKPYGAAAIIEQLLRTCATMLFSVESFRVTYTEFVETAVPGLIFSPSQRQLIHGLYALRTEAMFPKAFAGLLSGLLNADVSVEMKICALRVMFTHGMPIESSKVAQEMPQFQRFLAYDLAVGETENARSLFADLVKLQAVTPETTDVVLSTLTTSLSTSDQRLAGLSAIEVLSRTSESTVKSFMAKSDSEGDQLLPNLLRLEQLPDDNIAERAAALSSRLSSTVGETESDTRYSVILRNLERVSETSLPIDAMHELTKRLLGPEPSLESPSDLLPSLELWSSALCATLRSPKASLALLSSLGGGVHLVHGDVADPVQDVQYDGEGFSQALRIAMYVGRLLTETDALKSLGDMKSTVFALLQISVLVAEDNISIPGTNYLWKTQNIQETEPFILDFITESNRVLAAYWKTLTPDLRGDPSRGSSQFFSALERLPEEDDEQSPLSYYVALATSQSYANLFELHGFSTDQVNQVESIINSQWSAKRHLPFLSSVVGFQQPLTGTQTLKRCCNELVAELTDFNIEENAGRTLEDLILLNVILRAHEDLIVGVAKQRIIFLVKRMLIWLSSSTSLLIKSEVYRALVELLSAIDDMYGEHWDQTLSSVIDSLAGAADGTESGAIDEHRVLVVNTSLKLLGTLQKLSKPNEANDDLVDALKEKEDLIHDTLINLLLSARDTSDEWHQPLMITHELLTRQIASLPYKAGRNVDDLYPLIYAPSRPIQQAAFNLLHRQIPTAQEQISFDAALENKTAQLPDELLSLILESPTLDSLADASFQSYMPLSLQGYLFSWRLLFDHFNGSSYRVKSDYIEQLKDGTYLSGLLALTFDFLGHTRGRPVDVSKFDIQDYTFDVEPSPEKDVQWLLTHLYFLALTHLPSLVKGYYLDIRSRQTSQAVETWTAKHISPLIVDASLQSVTEWSEKSTKEDPEYEKMTVKVGMRSREINVSYVVDEQTMAMKVVLPESYPLASAQVMGVNRVAVKEEKWQSWLRNCQGVITFSVSAKTSPHLSLSC